MAEFYNEEIFHLELNDEDSLLDSNDDEIKLNTDHEPEVSNTIKETCDLTAENINPEKVKLGPKDFELKTLLGEGGFGKVYLVRKIAGHNCDRYFAMKVLKKASIVGSKSDFEHTLSERNILEAVKHPFIVDLVYAFQTDFKLYFILEYLRGGELFTHLNKEGMIFEDSTRFFACEIILALGYLHKLGVIYRDLKPENILLDAEGHIKLTDFGLSKDHMREGAVTHSLCGSILYMAPEIFTRRGHNKDVDWWSLGVLIYEMVTGDPPFASKSSILRAKIQFPNYLDRKTQNLVRRLLQRQVEQRLGSGPGDAFDVQSHSFFKNVNWEDVLARRLKPPFKPPARSDSDYSQFDVQFTKQRPVESPPKSPQSGDIHFEGFSYETTSFTEERRRANRQLAHSPRQHQDEECSGFQILDALRASCARAVPQHLQAFSSKYAKQSTVQSPAESTQIGDLHFEGLSIEAPSFLKERCRANQQLTHSPRQHHDKGCSGFQIQEALRASCARAVPQHLQAFSSKYAKQSPVQSPAESTQIGDLQFEGLSYEAPSFLEERRRTNRQPAQSPRQHQGEECSGFQILDALRASCARVVPQHLQDFDAPHPSPQDEKFIT